MTAELPFELVDWHVHLEGRVTLARARELSAERGVRFGIVEHGGFGQTLAEDDDLQRYVDGLAGTGLYAGLQAEGRDWMECFSASALERLDFVLTDALTFPYGGDVEPLRLWTPGVRVAEAEDFVERYVEFHEAILTREPIDVMANPTFLPRCLSERYETLWTEERMDRIIGAAVAHDAALEINARYRVPSLAFLGRARAAGARFAFGSNYHSEDVGRLDYCVDMARQLGLTADDLFGTDAD